MTVKTRETLMQRAMNGKPIMGQDLRDLIDTMFWLKASPEQKAAEVVKQVIGRSPPSAETGFPEVPGSGFVKIGTDGKWFTDPSTYLTKPMGDSYYFRNSLFPMDPALYLAGDRTFKNFVDSARAAFTGGDGIDITLGDIAVDNTVSRVGHQHALTLSGDVSGSGIVAGTIATTVNAIRGGVVPPPGSAGYFYWTGSSYSWVATPPPTTIALDDLADVALASVTAGQVLWYDGSVGQWINKMLGANDIPAHASRHHFDGSDPLAGQSIAGLLTSSSPTFSGLNVRTASAGTLADISFRATTDFRRMVIRWDNPNDRLELFSNNDDGSSRTGRILIPRSSSIPVSILLGLTVTGTTTLSTSLTGMLKATSGVISVAGASDLPLHATRHHWDGADPITGQLLNGLRSHETPSFGGIKSGSVTGYLSILGNTGTEIARFNSSGFVSFGNITLSGDLSIANLTGILYAQNGLVRVALGTDLPSHNHVASNISDSGAMGRLVLQMATATDLRTSILFGQTPIILNLSTGEISHSNADGSKHVPANGTINSGKVLVASSSPGLYTWENLGVAQIPSHASKHHSGGSDPLAGQSIAGLLTTSSPVFAALSLDGYLWLRNSGVRNWSIFGSNAFELASRNSDGSAIDWPIVIPHDAGGVIRLGGTTSRPVNLTYTLQMGGTETISATREGTLTKLMVKKALGASIDTASRVDILNDTATWGTSSWIDSGGNKRLSFLQGDATWTDRYTFGRNGNLNLLSGSYQIAEVDAITSTREGRFTGMRLSNMSSGQIPVASDANGQITASGLTDDGTFLGASRVLRMWNSLARSGNTWTDLQWTQDVNERVSILSSNSSGQYAYHSWVFVPPDAEATGRVLGGQMWGQKVSGKSGTAPGLKAAMYAKTAGTGGSTGGFGAQIVCNYRPDNGATQVDALKIGAFGGGVADAVEAAILLRANADFLANYAKIQKDADASVGLDVVGPSGTGKFRMLNSGGGSVLGINAGSLEISCANGIGIGTTAGNASLLVSTGDVSIAKTYFSSTHRVLPTERNISASTAIDDRLVVYTGTTNHTESLPAAMGSNRVIEFAHASSSGTWTLDADGTDMIAGELQARVGSIAILSNSSVKNRTLIDFAPGLWVVI